MTEQKFNEFWKVAFYPKVEKLLNKYPNILFDGNKKELIYKTYQENRTKIHDFMVDSEGRIDRHKIGATLVHSILRIQPFAGVPKQSSYDLRFSKAEFMPNECWAWHCSSSIVLSIILEEANMNNDSSTIQIFKDGFRYPPCVHDSYEEHVLRSLYYSRVNQKFDIFIFSHVLFLIEVYTKERNTSALIK